MATVNVTFILIIFSYLVLLIRGVYINNDNNIETDNIINGAKVNIVQVPYTVDIIIIVGNSSEKIIEGTCSGTIISAAWILTAAHCFTNFVEIQVYSGAQEINRNYSSSPIYPAKKHNVKRVIVNKKFKSRTSKKSADIALLKLEEPIVFDKYRQAIDIAKPGDIPKLGQTVTISGYGDKISPMLVRDSMDSPLDELRTVNEIVIDLKECMIRYAELNYLRKFGRGSAGVMVLPTDQVYKSSDFFCAATRQTGGLCDGDSGGPAVIHGKLAGVAKGSGHVCDSTFLRDVYVRVDLYHDWIREKIEIYN